MEQLQDLVTGSFAFAEDEEKLVPIEIAEQSNSANVIVSEGRLTEQFLAQEDLDPDQVRDQIVRMAAYYISGRGAVHYYRRHNASPLTPGPRLAFLLIDYLGDPEEQKLEEMRAFIRELNNQTEMASISRDVTRQIDFLGEYWGEPDLIDRLARVTDTKEASVRRWVRGSIPASNNARSINHLFMTVYQLQEGALMSKEEVLSWLDQPNPHISHKTPFESLAASAGSWMFPADLSSEINRVGGCL